MKIIKRVVTILVALVLGSIVGFFIYYAVNDQTRIEMRFPLVVAAVDNAPGTVLQSNDVMVVQWPLEFLPPQSAYMVHQVERRMAIAPLLRVSQSCCPNYSPRA